MKSFSVFALEDFPLVKLGDDIAKMIVESSRANGLELEDGDILIIAQKILSKAEGRIVNLCEIEPSKQALDMSKVTGKDPRLVELVLRETEKVVKATREILVVKDKRGLVCINAGIDKSNVEGRDSFALLPERPDESAEKCRLGIRKLTGKSVAVIVSDTYSRPFRRGQVNFAIGIAGIKPFKDYRKKKDLFGQVLRVKNVAIADELAAAAELLMGQATEARPVALLRGLNAIVEFHQKTSTEELLISREEDLFKGTL